MKWNEGEEEKKREKIKKLKNAHGTVLFDCWFISEFSGFSFYICSNAELKSQTFNEDDLIAHTIGTAESLFSSSFALKVSEMNIREVIFNFEMWFWAASSILSIWFWEAQTTLVGSTINYSFCFCFWCLHIFFLFSSIKWRNTLIYSRKLLYLKRF